MLLTCASSCLTYAPPTPTLLTTTITPRTLKAGSLIFLSARAMGSKRLLSSLPEPGLSITDNKKEKKIKGLMGLATQSENGVVKDIAAKSDTVDVQSMRDDPGKVETMTVQELRTTLRSIGVPAKGCKRDLVTTLKCFLNNRVDGGDDESFKLEDECNLSEMKASCTESVSVKRKTKNAKSVSNKNNAHDNKTILEVSGLQQSKKRGNKCPVEDGNVELTAELVTTKQKLSIQIEEVSGKKGSMSKRKVSSEISVQDVETSCQVDLSVNKIEPWTVLTHTKPQRGWIAYNPKTMRPPPPIADSNIVKLMSWNVNGLRALLKLEGFSALELAQREEFDVLCLQETKLQEKDVEAVKQCLDGYENSFWTCSVSKLGYSGTAIISRIKPLSVKYGLGISDHDSEGRLVTAEFDSFYLISGYIPNSGDGLRRLSYRVTQWDPSLSNHIKELEKSKPVILTGDLNCAHREIDIYNPAGNRRSAGFTVEERESFEKNFLSRGFVDTFREQHPDVVGYTYWGYRHNGRKTNKGWRLDYFLVSESIADKVHDSYILPDVTGSDHCPIGLILKL